VATGAGAAARSAAKRSVFIYPHECQEEVLAVAKWYGVEDHVRYLVATEIHDMRRFIEVFKLL
jgi:hypothetical protein